ncbi:MAG: hypothetical protein U0892_04700 [Pirellulales bacterium]
MTEEPSHAHPNATRDSDRRFTLLCLIPGITATLTFELFLGHRHDYSGHFAAGYGASLVAGLLFLKNLPSTASQTSRRRWIVPLCVIFIGLGVLTEATIFRIACFDVVDFCNQSLGAVLAACLFPAYATKSNPNSSAFEAGIIIGAVFLGAGGVLAVA